MLWIPISILAVLATYFYVKKADEPAPAGACDLTDSEKALLTKLFETPSSELAKRADAKGVGRDAAAAQLHMLAKQLEARGCADIAAQVHKKAYEVETPVLSSQPSALSLQQGVQHAAPDMAPVVLGSVMGGSGEYGGGYGGGGDEAMQGASAGNAPGVVVATMRTRDRTWVRPGPAFWDDSKGRQPGAFSIPKAYVVNVTEFGPPAGWAKVTLKHPDHGEVNKWVSLGDLEPTSVSADQPASQSAAPGQKVQATPAQQTALEGLLAQRRKKKGRGR